jgi:hypothetical protein
MAGNLDTWSKPTRTEAYSKIRTLLLHGDSEQTYSERVLAASLDLGLGPVRFALERLRAEGLIVVAANSGIRLPEITSREILDFYELRMVIECHVRFWSGRSWRPSKKGDTTTKRRGVLIALNSPARWWRFPHHGQWGRRHSPTSCAGSGDC